ncbi:hypothetical protein BO1005MUT1_190065 [Hyphomicrobiales bacterium]|nr:hypothetical protein BO1005MUT1_190065 [Hyphomicrobiales bacterium]
MFRPRLFRVDQIVERHAPERLDGFQDDIARKIADPRADLEKLVREHLIGGDVRADEMHEIVDRPADLRALHDKSHRQHHALEDLEILEAVIFQGHRRDDVDVAANLREHDMGLVTIDDAGLLEAPHPVEAGAGRKAHRFGQFLVGRAPVLLQAVQNAEVDLIQRDALAVVFHRSVLMQPDRMSMAGELRL